MQHRARWMSWGAWAALISGLLFLPLAGCSTPAQAEPLEVTYYYLPG
jgi:hypothetical protein